MLVVNWRPGVQHYSALFSLVTLGIQPLLYQEAIECYSELKSDKQRF